MSKTRVRHPIFARCYDRASQAMEQGGMAGRRRALLAGLSGQVIEVGAGNGLNFPHYPPQVTAVLAVEPEPHLRGIARRAAARASVPVEVVDGVADRLPAADAAFDAAVTSLVLCSVPDQRSALAEVYRVLRPGGELRFLEHVRSDTPGLRRVQRLLDTGLWPILAGGCHAGRDTIASIEDCGFTLRRLDRFRFPELRIALPTAPHILGVAARPDTTGGEGHTPCGAPGTGKNAPDDQDAAVTGKDDAPVP